MVGKGGWGFGSELFRVLYTKRGSWNMYVKSDVGVLGSCVNDLGFVCCLIQSGLEAVFGKL